MKRKYGTCNGETEGKRERLEVERTARVMPTEKMKEFRQINVKLSIDNWEGKTNFVECGIEPVEERGGRKEGIAK